jgi:hypothetical protein
LFEDLVWDGLKSSIEGIAGGGDMLKLLPEELLVKLPKTGLMCLGIIPHGVPRVMLRDAYTEGDKEQKRQGVASIFIATVAVNQAEATDESWMFHNLKDNN